MVPATCCPEGRGCCPSGYTCDLTDNTCTPQKDSLAVLTPTLIDVRPRSTNVTNIICPNGKSECPDGETCCQVGSDYFGCCHLPNAVCCADFKHCCPSGYVCNINDGSCIRSKVTMLKKKPAISRSFTNITEVHCPDGKACPDGNTCCQVLSGAYGCCAKANAVCCADRVHCCPNGYSCKSDGTCSKVNEKKKTLKLESVKCPDGGICLDGNTCCPENGNKYGCCSYFDANCCSDRIHCCPSGYTCDTARGTCFLGDSVMPMMKKLPSLRPPTELKKVICPDGRSECPNGNTCCELESGYGCCPREDAVCCADKVHCCPNGYACQGDGTCRRDTKVYEALAVVKLDTVECPDQGSCPDNNTCCLTSDDKYGCCPQSHATCCSDRIHCCPSGYLCDAARNSCTKGVPMIKKLSTLSSLTELKAVVCPDGRNECPDNNTCCVTSGNKYGCCPQPNANCCSDKIHCCPSGYTCDTARGTCFQGDSIMPMMKKLPSLSSITELKGVVCPDGKSECPSGSTCCIKSDSGYGCCPLARAVCCSDKIHCCPDGFSCDASNGTCVKEASVFSGLHKVLQPVYSKVKENVCPDRQSECSDINTCCKTDKGNYGCCQLPQATCCSDMKHCCPNGYICNFDGSCNRPNSFIQIEAALIKNKVKDVVCGDGNTSCKDDQTCCRLQNGYYGCCNLSDANCCGDGIHCCPNGYSCNVAGGTCVKEASVIPILKKTMAVSTEVRGNINCPDDTVCSESNTCCKTKSNSFGCCPSPEATCCADEVHCCPSGTSCDLEGHTCRVSEAKHQPLLRVSSMKKPVSNVVCPSVPGHEEKECPDNSTCCLMLEGKYGCCPFKDAVCCDDNKHCCPFDYACDPDDGTCKDKSNGVLNTIPPTKMSYKRPLL